MNIWTNKERIMNKLMMLSLCLFCFSIHAQQAEKDPFAEIDAEIKAH